jgi:hypothetical protein
MCDANELGAVGAAQPGRHSDARGAVRWGAVTAYHLAVRPTLIVAIAAVFAISLISGAVYLIVEALGRRHLTRERRADARLASAISACMRASRCSMRRPVGRREPDLLSDPRDNRGYTASGGAVRNDLEENVKRSPFDLGVDEAEAYIARRLDQHRNLGPVVERRLKLGERGKTPRVVYSARIRYDARRFDAA